MRTIQFFFNGEFGWEIIHWQAYCRKRAKDFDKAFVYSINTDSYPLYADFAEWGARRTNVAECWVKDRLVTFEKQKFLKFGSILYNEPKDIYFPDVLIHARNSKNVSKNYPVSHWSAVIKKLKVIGLVIGSIGSFKESIHIENTRDIRLTPLDVLSDYMASVKCIIGPSSGPMHLATLCGCPQVVWGDNRTYRGQTLKDRYEKSWNPFGTSVEFIETGLDWLADPDEIVERVKKFL